MWYSPRRLQQLILLVFTYMIIKDHGVRQLAAYTLSKHTHKDQTHTKIHKLKISLLREDLSLSPLLPQPFSLSLHSHSVRTPLAPVAVTMRCRQRPQHIHCSLHDERRTDTSSIRPCVRPSRSPFPRLTPVCRPLLILLSILSCSPS